MSSTIYDEVHYEAFWKNLNDAQVQVLRVVTSNPGIMKNDIIKELSDKYSKNPIANAIDSLVFAGLIAFKYARKQHQYYLTDDGIAFSDYVAEASNENQGGY